MKIRSRFHKFMPIFLLCFLLSGCVAVPKGFLKATEKSLENRQLQMRQYETQDQERIITSVAGVLQDLGFILDNSETELGFVAASKKADATNAGQTESISVFDIKQPPSLLENRPFLGLLLKLRFYRFRHFPPFSQFSTQTPALGFW